MIDYPKRMTHWERQRALDPHDLDQDGVALEGATHGAIFSSMHGKPGEIRVLNLERGGREFTVNIPVSAF